MGKKKEKSEHELKYKPPLQGQDTLQRCTKGVEKLVGGDYKFQTQEEQMTTDPNLVKKISHITYYELLK